ncbi:MAG: hypothetical protein M3R24_41600 [Chloroflexota bacterium]|nr:hypothetical protein [Chloroflexota bacterium]
MVDITPVAPLTEGLSEPARYGLVAGTADGILNGFVEFEVLNPVEQPVTTDGASSSAAPSFADAASNGGSASSDDDTYRAYLAQRFGKLGDHVLVLESVDIDHHRLKGKDYTSVTFNIEHAEATYFIEEDTSAARRAWATELLAELKVHWPDRDVRGSLLWSFVSPSVSSDTDCSSTGTTLLDDGWVHLVYFAKADYSADFGDDIDCIF